MDKDWTGNKQSTFVQLGATSHSRTGERAESDYYATDPDSLQIFLYAYKYLDGIQHLNKHPLDF